MRLVEGLDALHELDLASIYGDESADSRSVVAVGVFDGVHLGHHRLLHQLLEMASALQGMPTVVTFANHPDQVLRGDAPPPLCSVQHRLRLLRRAGVQRLVLLRFEPRLQNMTARVFAEHGIPLPALSDSQWYALYRQFDNDGKANLSQAECFRFAQSPAGRLGAACAQGGRRYVLERV